jgi:predicted permease
VRDKPSTSLIHRLLDRWTRALALLVPEELRASWRKEWDGELWYGVAAKSKAMRARAAVGLAVGALRDALAVRRGDNGFRGRTRDEEGDGMMGSMIADIRYSLRALRKTPVFTAVAVATLAIGVGSAVTIFSVVDALLLSPLPYPNADRLVMLWQGRRAADVDKDWFSFGHFTDIQSRTTVFEDLGYTEGGSRTMTGRGRATEVGWVAASSTYLRMLGTEPTLGRLLDEQDDRGDAAQVALLTHDLWQRAYGGDPGVVGETITLNGEDIEIVGVLPPDLLLNGEVMPTAGANARVDVVLSFPVTAEMLSDRLTEWYNIVGKLAPGVTLAEAQAQLDDVAANVQRLHEDDPDSGFFIHAVPLLEEVVGPVRRALIVLFASVGGVLIIACLNVANLLLARGASRHRELGVRAAMGAEKGRLFGQLLTESAVLATLGGALGVALAAAGLWTVRRVGEASLPRITEIGIDGSVLLFSLAVTMTTCLVFGLVPARRAARIDLVDSLKPGGRGGTGEGSLWSRFNLSNGLVVVEIGLSLVLLVGGGLLLRSFMALEQVDPGFEVEGRLTFRLSLTGDAYGQRGDRVAFYDALLERLEALPGVESVGAATQVPMNGGVSWGPMDIADYVPPQGENHQIIADFRLTSAGYFRTLDIPVIRGRAFDERDNLDAPPVSIIDENFADTYFPDRDPLGMQLVGFLGRTSTIVGVVGDVKREALDRTSRVTVYQPHGQWGARTMYVAVATTGDPDALVAPALRAVSDLDPDIAVVDVLPMQARLAASLAERRFAMGLLQVLGLVALVLAAVGVYGLVSYRVSQGARELSLRMALGASSERIMRLVVRHGLTLAALGVAGGLIAALPLSRLMDAMLFQVSAFDIRTYVGVATGLLLTAMIACYLPARRATRANPLDAISGE